MEEWEVCAEAQNGVEAVEKHWYIQPHVTVMDFNTPDLNGLFGFTRNSAEISRRNHSAADGVRIPATCDQSQKGRHKRLLFKNRG